MLSAGFYSNHINFRLNENPVEFLDNTELKCLNHLAEKVLVNFIRGIPKTNHIAASTISYYVEYFQKALTLSKELIQNFCLWLAILKTDISFSETERDIFNKIILQCKRFAQSPNTVLPDEQSEFSESFISQQITTLKSFNEHIKENDPNFRQRLVNTDYGEAMGKLYDAMQQAYSEGIALLKSPGNINTLKELMTATRIDKNHDEFIVTGEHHDNIHKNSTMRRGFTKPDGTKSSMPIYSNGENILFQSHPGLSPLSMNPESDFYHPQKIRKGGDLGHIFEANKKMFAINREGDIFFSNPNLAGICLNEIAGCRNLGQVYLGNIKDFQE